MVVPISEKFSEYCDSVYLYFHKMGYQVEVDHSNLTLNKKIRNHQLGQWNFICVAGEEEANSGTVDIRSRNNERIGKMRVDEAHHYFQSQLP
jgi:threonyl-tRNA synthetase